MFLQQGASIATVTSDVFRYNTKLRYIDIGDNTFNRIPYDLFENLDTLSEFRASNIDWKCSCSNTWFVAYAQNRNITLIGDFVCSSGKDKHALV